jgi:hypothetical protein
LNEHDRRVIEAAQAVQSACEAGEASAIAKAVSALNAISQGQAVAETPAAPVLTNTSPAEPLEPAAEAAPSVTADATESTPATADGEPTPDSPAIEAPAEAAPVAKPVAPPKKLVAVRGDDRPGQAKGTATAAVERARAPRRDDKFAAGGRDARRDEGRFPAREERAPRGPRVGDAAFRAQRQALELAEQQMRRLATMAHGEVLTQLLSAWEQRQSDAMPTAQTLGSRVNAATRTAWAQALQSAPAAADASALLRLEMAAEVPTPAEQLDARRQLQLQLLTRRNDAPPAQTWAQDVARVLAQPHDATQARRLQTVLKVLLKR